MSEMLYLGAALLSVANGVVVVLVNPRRAVNRVFLLTSLLIASWFFCVFMAIVEGAKYSSGPAHELLFWLRLSSGVAAFIIVGALWLLKSILLEDVISVSRVLRSMWPWFGVSCVLAALAFTEAYIPSNSTPADPKRGIGYIVYTAAVTGCCIWLLIDGSKQMRRISGVRRIEMQFFVWNMGLSCLLLISINFFGHLLDILSLRHMGPFLFILLHGLTVWAVCYHRVFDARQVMILLGQRIAMLSLLGGGAFGLTSLLSRLMAYPASLILGVILAGVIAFFCDQITRKWLGLDPDHVLAEPRSKIIEWSRSESDPEKLRGLFEIFLRHWCQTDLAELLVASGSAYTGRSLALANHGFVNLCRQGWVTPEHLQRLPPGPAVVESMGLMSSQGLAAVLAVPRGGDSPSLLVVLGPKHSLRPYTYRDITLLLSLAELMDNILSHSRLAHHAAQIARMESAAMMSRGLAHDLNNLATPVSAFLLHMEDRVEAGTAEAAVLSDAKHAIKVMQDYIRESMFFARRLVPEFISVSSSEILPSVIRLTQDRARNQGVQVIVRADEDFSFQADRALVQRLLQNLVFNGIDASKRGDSVELSAVAFEMKYVGFKVTDHGAGIPAGTIDRIFEPYFTTKDTGDDVRGLGLGLAICRKIVDLHSGKIEASSGSGLGTTFTVIFPKAQSSQPGIPVHSTKSATTGELPAPRTGNTEVIISCPPA